MLKKLLIVAMLGSSLVVQPAPAVADDKTIQVTDDDVEMNAAIATARASLPSFWQEMKAPGPGVAGFALKVAIPYAENRREHFWLTEIERHGDTISGLISNDPNNAKHVVKGQRYDFTDADISDWSFRRNGKIVGNETMRPLLKRLPPDDAERYRAMRETP